MPHVYMLITTDEYELPLIVADTATELAEKAGVRRYSVLSAICRAKKRGWKSKYIRVDWEEGGDTDV